MLVTQWNGWPVSGTEGNELLWDLGFCRVPAGMEWWSQMQSVWGSRASFGLWTFRQNLVNLRYVCKMRDVIVLGICPSRGICRLPGGLQLAMQFQDISVWSTVFFGVPRLGCTHGPATLISRRISEYKTVCREPFV